MEYLIVLLSTLLSLLILFILTKLIGQREVSSMSLYDYINSITLGSIAAQLAVSTNKDILKHAIAMVLYGIFTYLCAIGSNKSRSFRKIIAGCPVILMENGKFNYDAFNRSRVDADEFLAYLRSLGYFDISRVECAVMETNGKISVLPKSGERPASPNDLGLSVPQEELCPTLVIDGKPLEDNLKRAGFDMSRLNKELASQHLKLKDTFLAVWDGSHLRAYPIRQEAGKSLF